MMPELQEQPRTKIDIFKLETDFVYDTATTAAPTFSVSLPQQTTKILIFHTAVENKMQKAEGEEGLPALPKPLLRCQRHCQVPRCTSRGTAPESRTWLRFPEDTG